MDPARELPHLGVLRLPAEAPMLGLLRRTLLAIGIVLVVAIVLWFTRDGIRDQANPGQPLGFIEITYFTVVSLTTVGYGDIAPVTAEARLINTVLLTPVRLFLFVLFLGTAYELALLRFGLMEGYHMRRLLERLADHIIICGFGVKGRTIVSELLAHGHHPDNIVIIDPVEEAVAAATEQGLVALRGDASSEALLRAAGVEKAAYVLAAPDRDDACVLICLTVRSLAPHVYLVASAREEENIKLLYRAGANLVVAPSVSGGRLMAATVRQHAVPRFLEDLLSFGQGIDMAERTIQPEEAGLPLTNLPGLAGELVLGVVRGEERFPFYRLADMRLQAGDVVVYFTENPSRQPPPG
jgi:voltage-gated potassium channel